MEQALENSSANQWPCVCEHDGLMRNEPLCEVGGIWLDGIKENTRTVMWTLHQMNRMSQGKGRGSRVKMVYKENERKTAKKKKKIKNNVGMEQQQRKKRECIKTNIWSTTTPPIRSQSTTLKALPSHPIQSCTKVKTLSCVWTCLFLTGVMLEVQIQ